MYKENLALNNLQWLICHEPKPNQSSLVLMFLFISFMKYVKTLNSSKLSKIIMLITIILDTTEFVYLKDCVCIILTETITILFEFFFFLK